MDHKLIGGILMVVGTAIGAGMLALPLATAQTGYLYSIGVLLICWFIMTSGALLLLEANLWLPARSNIISMARHTLGKGGEVVAWITYLILLYSLMAAYIAGGGDFLRNLIMMTGINLNPKISLLLFTGILGFVVYLGVVAVVGTNRYLMFSKFGVYLLLVILILPFLSWHQLSGGNLRYFTTGITVAITSFGFANIIPSLRVYFEDDVKKLRRAVVIGSVIPLICYLVWDLVVMGVIPREGANGLIAMFHSKHSTSDFVTQLSLILNRNFISLLAHIFTAICLATSFLGVALSLTDFFADGFKIVKESERGYIVYALTFLPPLVVVIFYPGAFITALNYAGIDCIILLVILPALMVWHGRYKKMVATDSEYKVKGGKILLVFLIIAAVGAIVHGLYQNFIH